MATFFLPLLLQPPRTIIRAPFAAAFQITRATTTRTRTRTYQSIHPPPKASLPQTSSLSTKLFSTKPDKITWETRQKCWRPTVQDVERISFGKPAKKKGTGSRGVPHRLNEEERKLFDQARRKGFLEVGGSGWRSQRRDAPLVNTYRSLCDARGQVCIALHKGNTGMDELVVDVSPLRLPETFKDIEQNLVDFVGLETSYRESENEQEDLDESEVDIVDSGDSDEDFYDSRPIYQLPPNCISWEVERSEGKKLGKTLAKQFNTIEANASKSKKPRNVKAGKNRRSGGYGIG